MTPQHCVIKRKQQISLIFVTLLLFQVKFNPGNLDNLTDLPALNLTTNSENSKKSVKRKPQSLRGSNKTKTSQDHSLTGNNKTKTPQDHSLRGNNKTKTPQMEYLYKAY